MALVMTVTGPIAEGDIGPTAVHEHLVCDLFRVNRQPAFLMNDVETAIAELRLFHDAGGRTLVELTTPDLSRDARALKRISEETRVNIVMGCGWYLPTTYPADIDRRSVEDLARVIEQDIAEGVEGTGIRPGIIGEIGSAREHVSALEERVFRAAARAHKRTGLALSTHTSFSAVGLEQLDILSEEGADLRKVSIGHCDTYLVVEYHEEIIRRGAFVQFDSIGRSVNNSDSRRASVIADLVRRGYAANLLLSSDICMRSDWHALGGVGYDYCLRNFVPRLREEGIDDEAIQMMLVHNPARLLAA
jgi:phosphotriesterase-related protein